MTQRWPLSARRMAALTAIVVAPTPPRTPSTNTSLPPLAIAGCSLGSPFRILLQTLFSVSRTSGLEEIFGDAGGLQFLVEENVVPVADGHDIDLRLAFSASSLMRTSGFSTPETSTIRRRGALALGERRDRRFDRSPGDTRRRRRRGRRAPGGRAPRFPGSDTNAIAAGAGERSNETTLLKRSVIGGSFASAAGATRTDGRLRRPAPPARSRRAAR